MILNQSILQAITRQKYKVNSNHHVFFFFLQTGVAEMTWVVADHSAAPGTRELSVTKGQQVEVLENGSGSGLSSNGGSGNGEWTLVRLASTPGQSEPPAEGLVPTSALKQPPAATCKTSPSRKPPPAAAQTQTPVQQTSINADDGEFRQ